MINPILLFEAGKSKLPFVSTWNTETTTVGSSPVKTIKLPLVNGGTYNFLVDWGDGTAKQTITVWNQAETTHTYAVASTPTITITGTITGWKFNGTGDRNKITSIVSWGVLRFINGINAFYQCEKISLESVKDIPIFGPGMIDLTWFLGLSALTNPAAKVNNLEKWRFQPNSDLTHLLTNYPNINQNLEALDVSNVKVLAFMFSSCDKFNSSLNSWNTSNCTDINSLFLNGTLWNNGQAPGVSTVWQIDTSKCTDFTQVFSQLTAFNQDISGWDVSKVTVFNTMFGNNNKFNQNLNPWNTISATNLGSTFTGCSIFNNGMANGATGVMTWNVSNVTNFAATFNACAAFNQDITAWNVAKGTTFLNMFSSAAKFNQNLSSWDVGAATTLAGMFTSASAFNNGLAAGVAGVLNWNTSNVTTLQDTFNNADAFNCDVSSWDVRKVTNFAQTFYSLPYFNQPLNSWVTTALTGSGLATTFGNSPAFNQVLNNWNTSKVTSMSQCFQSCTAFNNGQASGVSTVMTWDTSAVTNMSLMFNNCVNFNQDITGWNVSKVATPNSMFAGASKFNQPIGVWTTTAFNTLSGIFTGATIFNQNLNNWNTAAVTNCTSAFESATAFNNGMASGATGVMTWNMSNVTLMTSMFYLASSFNQDITGWDTTKVTQMNATFNSAIKFNQPIGVWNTANVTLMNNMFDTASAFNQPLTNFNTAKVTTFSAMFSNATIFNQPLSHFNTAAVTTMASMFTNAAAFNQSIGNWDVTKVTSMNAMFQGATAFDQNIGNWKPIACTNFGNFMTGKTAATFSAANLDAIYNGWTTNLLAVTPAGGINFGSAKYTAAGAEGRALLSRTATSLAISSIANNGSGLIRVVSLAHGRTTGNKVFISAVAAGTNANGLWTVTVINSTTVDLQGSTFAAAAGSGGTMRTGYGWTMTDGGSNMTTNTIGAYSLANTPNDASGVSPNGVATGVTYVTGVSGLTTSAARFTSGSIDIAITGNNFSFTDNTNDIPFSINMWVYFLGFSSVGNWLINKRGTVALVNLEWQFYYDTPSNKLVFTKYDQGGGGSTIGQSIASPVSPFALNTWYNITFTDDGSKTVAGMKMYINGVLISTTDASSGGTYTGMLIKNSVTRIGAAANSAANTNHNGYIEDLNVWKGRVITADEIAYLNNTASRTYPFP